MNLLFILPFLFIPLILCAYDYPETPQLPVANDYHGNNITDKYQWLEDMNNPEVRRWIKAQEDFTNSILKDIPQIPWLKQRFDALWRYDDVSLPKKVYNGTRLFYTVQKEDKEHLILYTKASEESPEKLLIDPNTWEEGEDLHFWKPSRDGRYLAFGKSRGGDESPVLYIMDAETNEILPDKVKGWRQRISDWLPDSSGFYYVANPIKGSVPEGEENYWQAVYLHIIGTPEESDRKIWYSDETKELHHYIYFSEDGLYEIWGRGVFYENELYIRNAGGDSELIPVVTGFDAHYSINIYDNKIYINTDYEAPNRMVYVSDIKKPQRENWKVFIPETKYVLTGFDGIEGVFYASYLYNGYTSIKAYNPEGSFIKDVPLPSIGTASISGWWKKDETRLFFSSFAVPHTVYRYHIENNSLIVIKEPREIFKTEDIRTGIVKYNSKDGTEIPMFLIYKNSIEKNGKNPVILSGYGGFNISTQPYFSPLFYVLLEKDVMIALPMLRGGGEFGKEWHEAGMFGNKQNVFDDFISAAEWLIKNKYTNPERLAIQGGSNGGLLVGTVTVQRPDLFKAVLCRVPLLDMLRYHKFDYANIWAREYGSSDDPLQFDYIYKYSPYHNIREKTNYPAVLFSASENDARTAPFHAMKMTAAMQKANVSSNPILLLVNKGSGHGGGTTINEKIAQSAIDWGFVLYYIGVD